ncbi:ABC transporter substrate-binding protein [Terasakiella sp. A23]|uniref:ABC transporter substrate-binding protein n=1 Tax=Terasakiella sp. FCG-A23 TaxID=3080561 RepID=UPI0029547ABF|nr:ABC transporter substrate-binding protein [Terasakiella sp. A23]MDV7340508.1 ABC transporter substrate-binding protein [Terasakiella sp. A23]
MCSKILSKAKLILIPLCVTVCTFLGSVQAQTLEKLSLKLQWLHQFQFAGYYVAKEKGFYRDAGLNVEIVPYEEGSQNVVDLVRTGVVNFGTGRSSLVVDRLNGKPVVVLAAIFQESPSVLLVRKGNGIERLTNLIGRKVMVSPDALLAADYFGMFAKEGISPHDIVSQKHSYNLDDLIDGTTDAMACYISNEPYVLQERGVPFLAFRPKDYVEGFYGDMLFTSIRETMNHPERVSRFKAASLKGWDYAFENIEETAEIIFNKYNKQNKTLASLIFEGHELRKLALPPDTPLGHISLQKLNTLANLYYSQGLISDTKGLTGIVFSD